MRKLREILDGVACVEVIGSLEREVLNITFDSRKAVENMVFVAMRGTVADGHLYISKAIEQGCRLIICEEIPAVIDTEVTYIKVANSNEALATIASNFYNHPSKKLKLTGVTGTNGKTTTASLLYQLFTEAGYKVGLLSTVKILIGKEEYAATHTTPDSLTINYYLNKMVEEGCEYCFMEVSSHGIAQKRTHALHFECGIFTNLSHDHLDYHNTFAEYRDVKKQFFDQLLPTAVAITNADDKNGAFMLQNTKAKAFTYGVKNIADYHATILESEISGMLLRIDNREVWVQLIGVFNASNLLAVYSAAVQLGINKEDALVYLSKLKSVSGRFQYIVSKSKISAIVDYAHTPDALENVLKTIKDIQKQGQQIITIVGCGGNRDAAKRPEMGRIAVEYSDQVVFTSDNPRFEDPNDILHQIEEGVAVSQKHKVLTIEDRRQAIKTAVKIAQSGDILLIAGKGHEDYQEIKGVKYPFDDLEEVTIIFEQLNK